ncbi:MAG: porphobilinogen deaminase [Rickettsiaceae bacterium]|jgi:hydroxymethylbilane synthase|nr:porphobilinogen deaminase [Rickettsiaceae bacterium]
MDKILKLGTRGSKLALTQANLVLNKLEKLGIKAEIVPITTTGDKITNKTLYDIGGKALFLKEIEEALLAGEVDLAVHSMKDVPAELPNGLIIASVLERENPQDMLISKFPDINSLPIGAVVGTSSVRRIVQIKAINPNVIIENLRGNIDSRLSRYLAGEFDAIILASAGLNRLGLTHSDFKLIPVEQMVPAVGQGFIAIEIRENDEELKNICLQLNHVDSWNALQAERGFLETLKGDCRTPMGAYAKNIDGKLNINYFLAEIDGSNIRKTIEVCDIDKAYDNGKFIATKFIADK